MVHQIRIYSGLILLLFVTLHLLNLTLGLVSFDVMNAARGAPCPAPSFSAAPCYSMR